MNDYQPYRPPEFEEQTKLPAGRRLLPWLFGCLATIVLAVAVVGMIFFVISDDGDGQAAATTGIEAPGGQVAGASEVESEPAELPTGQAEPEEAGSLAAEPVATATAEPAPADDSEPLATPAEPPGTADTAFSPAGRIAIVDNRGRLWAIAPDGSDRRLLSERGRFYQFPSWSPAGDDIAVIGSDRNGSGVYVAADEPGGQMRQLYADPTSAPIYLYWSPEGDSVSFITSHQGGLALHLANKEGVTGTDIVATSPSTFFWDWMPDGSQVLVHTGFTARESADSRLAFIPLEGELDATEIAQSGFFQAPAVAADGRYYSYGDEDADGERWLSIWDNDSDQQVEMVNHQGVVAMSFSPTRSQLAYTSPERPTLSFHGPLRLLDLESGQSRLLVSETVLAYFWSPDGRSIAYLTLSAIDGPLDFDDAPMALADEALVDQIDFTGRDRGRPFWKVQQPAQGESRIGLGLSVVDVDSGQSRLLTVFEPTNLFVNQFLPFFDQYALSHRVWSPDSQALVLPMKHDGKSFILVVPADGGEPAVIAHGVAAFWSHR